MKNCFVDKKVDFIVILDHDNEGRSVQAELKSLNYNHCEKILTLNEIIPLSLKNFTIEEILPSSALVEIVNNYYSNSNLFVVDNQKSFIESVKEYKGKHNISTDLDLKELKSIIPSKIQNHIKKLDKGDFEKEYEKTISFLQNFEGKV